MRRLRQRFLILAIAGFMVTLGLAPESSALLPFNPTFDLFVLDDGSKNILRITPAGRVSIAVTRAEIEAATVEH